MSLKICSLVFSVTENMFFSLNKSSTHAVRVQVIFLEKLQERSAGTYLIGTYSMQKEQSGIINFWLVVLWSFSIFGSW